MEKLKAIKVTRKTGAEPFTNHQVLSNMNLQDFWAWSSSDITGNALRGMLAEYIVAASLNCTTGIRREWDAYDIETPSGIKVEVKSAAYVQSWDQSQLSKIQFSIGPTQKWCGTTNAYSTEKTRAANVYVFCILAHTDKLTINPLDLTQWEFYCIATKVLSRGQLTKRNKSYAKLFEAFVVTGTALVQPVCPVPRHNRPLS